MSPKRHRCNTCRENEKASGADADPLGPHRESLQHAVPDYEVVQQPLDAANSVTTNQEHKYLDSAKSVAKILAELGEQGFNHVLTGERKGGPVIGELWWSSLVRLARCADHYRIPKQRRKDASQCGGVPPDPNLGLKPLQGGRTSPMQETTYIMLS